MRGGSCITCGHRPPGPRAAGSRETGASTRNPQKSRHINRVVVLDLDLVLDLVLAGVLDEDVEMGGGYWHGF